MGTYFDAGYMIKSLPILLSYIHITLGLTLAAVAGGFAIGGIVAVICLNRVAILSGLSRVYISFIRGTPFLVQLFLFYFGLPELLVQIGFSGAKNVSGIIYVALVFCVHVGAYSAEILRGAILAVPKGQMEAALACGMTAAQSYIRIIFPQAIRIAAAPLGNMIVSSLKDTSLVFNVGIIDMMRRADLMGANSQRNLELYLDAAIIYVALVLAMNTGGKIIYRLWQRRAS
jgi:His/Glu/Gln/Arg/opine family amino acid ABC transporter permease subunit